MLPIGPLLTLSLACSKDEPQDSVAADDTGTFPCAGDQPYETFYLDDDGDGYGRTDEPLEACQPTPSGYALRADDCDDTNAVVHPDQKEDCATEDDDDCDGTANQPTGVNLVHCIDYFVDTDGDGFGNGAETLCLCEPDATHTADAAGDCDNRDAKVYPGTQTCVALEPEVWTARIDGEGVDAIGEYVFAAALDAVPGRDLVLGEPDANGDAGALFVVPGTTTGTVTLDDASVTRIDGTKASKLGTAFAGPGPFVGSGMQVVAETAQGLLVLDADTFLADGVSNPFATITGAAGPAAFGDQAGDGRVELLASCTDCGPKGEGAAYVISDPPAGSNAADDIATVRIAGIASGDFEGARITDAGDMDGDGLADLAMGAPDAELGSGSAYVFLSPQPALATLDDADAVLFPDELDLDLGWAVAGAADFDDDGYADLAVGSKRHGMNGGVFVLSGPPISAKSGVDSDAIIRGHPGDWHGFSIAVLAAAGPDAIAVGAPHAAFAADDAGSVTTIVGPLSGGYYLQADGVTLLESEVDSAFGIATTAMDDALVIGARDAEHVFIVPASVFGL